PRDRPRHGAVPRAGPSPKIIVGSRANTRGPRRLRTRHSSGKRTAQRLRPSTPPCHDERGADSARAPAGGMSLRPRGQVQAFWRGGSMASEIKLPELGENVEGGDV